MVNKAGRAGMFPPAASINRMAVRQSAMKLKIVADDKIPFLRGALEPFAEMVYLPGGAIAPADVKDADALITRDPDPLRRDAAGRVARPFHRDCDDRLRPYRHGVSAPGRNRLAQCAGLQCCERRPVYRQRPGFVRSGIMRKDARRDWSRQCRFESRGAWGSARHAGAAERSPAGGAGGKCGVHGAAGAAGRSRFRDDSHAFDPRRAPTRPFIFAVRGFRN